MDLQGLTAHYRRSIAETYRALVAEELEPGAFAIVVVKLRANPTGRRLVGLLEADLDLLADVDLHATNATYFNRAANHGLAAFFDMPRIAEPVQRGFVRVVVSSAEGTSAIELPKRVVLSGSACSVRPSSLPCTPAGG